MNTVDKLMQDAIDMHVHHGPDAGMERSVDALQAALQAQEAGMRAIVLKSHNYPTAPVAYTVNQVIPNFIVLGSIALDFEVGGLNVHALETSARLGAKVVWMPTFSSANDMKKRNLNQEGITIFDEKGKLLPVIDEILEIIRDSRMVLATGHLSTAEAFALVDAAKERGVNKIVITHPLAKQVGACLSLDEQGKMAEKGAFIEHCFVATLFPEDSIEPIKIAEAIKSIGAEHCIISTDLGQAHNPKPAEGMKMMITIMLGCGLSEKELELMVKVNPAKLLDMD